VTDGLDADMANAGLDLLAADTALTVHDGRVPDGATPPYVLVYTTVSRPQDHPGSKLPGDSRGFVARWICHCVGANAAAARAVAQRVRTQLLDVKPIVPGLLCHPVRQADVLPPQKDESTGALVMDLVADYEVYACPE
jgi:hypothetical protein